MFLAFLLTAFLAGFSNDANDASALPCKRPSHGVTDASEVSASAFSLRVPRTFVKFDTPTSAEVSGWRRGEAILGFEYGARANDLSALRSLDEVRKCTTKIGGRAVTVLLGRGPAGEYLAAAHWARQGDSSPIMPLTVSGQSNTEEGQQELLAIIWSVQFRKPA